VVGTSRVFKAQIDAWLQKAPEKLDAFARQICFEMAERVVDNTPVDTGFLRGSWQPSIGEPSLDHQGKPDKGGVAVATVVAMVIPAMRAGQKFYMMNNAAYARPLEYGTSKMAGRFYVSDTVKNWQSAADQVAQELGLKK
jgi:hypothetical protein